MEKPEPIGPGDFDEALRGTVDEQGRAVGRWVERDPEGKVVQAVECADGVLHGPVEASFPDGSRAAEGEFEKGRQQGTFRTWWPSGGLRSEAIYCDGLAHGPCASWYEDGGRRDQGGWRDGFEHGRWRVWYADGTPASETVVVYGTPHGVIRDFAPDGRLVHEQHFVHGVFADRGFSWAEGLGRGRPSPAFVVIFCALVGVLFAVEPVIVLGLTALGLSILVHEAGHALAARGVGIPIQVFQVGFGPSLASFFWRRTLWQIRLVPIFGYVRPHVQRRSEYVRARRLMAGVDAAGLPPVDPTEKPETVVQHVSRPARLVFYAGGIVANFLLAAFLIWLIRSPADPLGALEFTARFCGRVLAAMPDMLVRLIDPGSYTEYTPGLLGGMKEAAPEHRSFLTMFVVLNVVLAAFNLLPLPLLDGFWCLKATVETVIRRDVPRLLLAPLHVIGIVMLVGLGLTGLFFLGRDILMMLFC
jgi:antitoxin component YwqK of YwqJK toxin-antitoxin module